MHLTVEISYMGEINWLLLRTGIPPVRLLTIGNRENKPARRLGDDERYLKAPDTP